MTDLHTVSGDGIAAGAERYADDFETWARECVTIADKLTGREVPFVLNAPQRRLLGVMERQRRAGRPVRVILLKSRQWGGSTLVECYMAWMQLVRRSGWNSLVCAHVRDASAAIRGMYARLLDHYPAELKTGDAAAWRFAPYQKSTWVSHVAARRALVAVATAQSPNALRGFNFAMAHLSEVAFWGDGDRRLAADIVRTVAGSVAPLPDTVVVMESTADGRDNYFHDEWRRAVEGHSDKTPVFVPWHEIESCRLPLDTPAARSRFEAALDGYERALLDGGVPPEAVAWYQCKRREYPSHEAMMAEFPSTPDEAFAAVGGDTLLDAATLPGAPAACGDDPAACGRLTAVLLAAHRGHGQVLSLFATGSDGSLTALSDRMCDCAAPALADLAVAECRRLGARLLVAEPPESDIPAHGRLCARRAAACGVGLVYDAGESEVTRLDAPLLCDGADRLGELAAAGRYADTSAEGLRQLRAASLRAAATQPLALTRLAMAAALRPQPPLRPSDFDW